jgi:S1-C subfamily serine protease
MPTTNLSQFSNELAAIAAKASASVVTVHGSHRQRLSSSGIVWRNGFVVTTHAGLHRDEDLHVSLPDGTKVAATLKGRDASTDLALLACDTGSAAPVAVSQSPARLAELVLTVGRTAHTGPIVTMGIVSGVAGEWQTWRGARLDEFVRLDASIYPTSIGGAVLNSQGEAFGIVAGGLSRSSVLVITRKTIERVAETLATKGRIARGYIGVGLQTVAIPQALKKQFNIAQEAGIMALSVEENGPAAKAGIMMGDVLISIDNRPVADVETLHAALDPASVGKQLGVVILRGASRHELSVTIGERPVKTSE